MLFSNTSISLYFIGVLLCMQATAQQACITGKVPGGRNGQQVSVSYWVQPGISPAITQETALVRDSFYCSIPEAQAGPLFFYADAGEGRSFQGIIGRNDSIHIIFSGDTILLSGRGAACSRVLYVCKRSLSATTGDATRQMEREKQSVQAIETQLSRCRDSMPADMHALLRADLLGQVGSRMIGTFWQQDPDLQETIYQQHIRPALPDIPGSEQNALSARFLAYQLEKAQVDYYRSSHLQCTNSAVYEWIKTHYSSGLQEKLLAHQLLMAFAMGGMEEELENCAKDYLAFVHDPICKQAVAIPYNKMKRGIRKGIPAPAFSLPDLQGNPVSLSQFAGKVVLLHFCSDDDNLLPTLDEISKCFQNDPVAFLHIGMKPFAVKGVGIQLYPGAQFATMQQQYNVNACPTLIVITRDGNIFAVKPPNPAEDYGTALTNIIYEALQQ
ncbi:TlpA disulfide reductase family protein [Chitinophaga sp. sic0106]|uniref:TlpA family protein disulfide reductase n=1 Tax=Chitinophaga sp. sic0106 TaxID=2854785 RepID=UPI001C448698|nr:TlpA disulfide reductase family protein [Chitinophaga sp. sic0106]MBV7533853.1 TlpA family protein disulfide reductase [Chitinophaga sp. sic0106]